MYKMGMGAESDHKLKCIFDPINVFDPRLK